MTVVRVQTIQPDVRTQAPEAHSYHLKVDWKSDSGQCSPSTTHMEPPRPLEPRPTHERSLSRQDSPRHDPFFNQNGMTSRPSMPSLPSVKTLLPPLTTNGQPQYQSWRNERPPQHDYRHPYPQQPYHQQDRRIELPVLETQPVARYAQHPPITSPHPPFNDISRDCADSVIARPRQPSTSSYTGNSASSPYTPATFDDTASRGSGSTYERTISSAYTPTSVDSKSRYVGIRDFPGEGLCHVYEDGHRIPTQVDGEQVNPQWGLTKANKPRKRLAVACLDCREKKIKCEPGIASCLQCEKAKRPCRKSAVAQAQQNDNASVDWSPPAGSPPVHITSPDETMTKRRAQEELAVNTSAVKRQKSTSPLDSNNAGSPDSKTPVKPYCGTVDPMKVDPRLVTQLLEGYFGLFNNGVYNLFPKDTFMRWATGAQDKSPPELMVVYAMLAMASIYDHGIHDRFGKLFAQVASDAVVDKAGRFSLQVAHTRLLLALYHYSTVADSGSGLAWEHCGSAMRAISALGYNDETECAAGISGEGRQDYGLSPRQLVECRRRAFWCGSMMDRYFGFCEGMLCTVSKPDTYLRLPCSEEVYREGVDSSEAPFYDNGLIEKCETELGPTSPVSSMAHLVLITEIWSDITAFANQGSRRSPVGYAAAYEAFRADISRRLRTWTLRLPEHLRYSEANMLRSLQEEYAGDFIHMHLYFYYCLLKLSRWMRISLNTEHLHRNIVEAHMYAHRMLDISGSLREMLRKQPAPRFSTPFVGNALLSAVDIVGAGGHDGTLGKSTDKVNASNAAFNDLQLAPYWKSAEKQLRLCEQRFFTLSNIITRPYRALAGCWLGRHWGHEYALENEQDLADDCIYGVKDKVFYDAIEKMISGKLTAAFE